ncbi:hypothetical protein F2P81_001611 [Scophthalmus maximus]|uniref:Uncharacterized protein n=1 Tax=Scophthalmus maximus TaxID=52904 RepID=A0A6A4TSP2_SCOMX|nr:hypothetical protein F2P81_001611 [Scophthalmus maximus]
MRLTQTNRSRNQSQRTYRAIKRSSASFPYDARCRTTSGEPATAMRQSPSHRRACKKSHGGIVREEKEEVVFKNSCPVVSTPCLRLSRIRRQGSEKAVGFGVSDGQLEPTGFCPLSRTATTGRRSQTRTKLL